MSATSTMDRRRFLGAVVFVVGAPLVLVAWLTPAIAQLGLTPPKPTANPKRVTVFGDSITDSAVAEGRIASAPLAGRLTVAWNTAPYLSTYHFRSGFEKAARDQPDVVVIATGTNDSQEEIGAVQATSIDNALDALAEIDCVVWVNVRSEIGPHHAAWNQLLTERAFAAGNVRVADWDEHSNRHPEWIHPDNVHLTGDGQVVYAEWLVAEMVLGCP